MIKCIRQFSHVLWISAVSLIPGVAQEWEGTVITQDCNYDVLRPMAVGVYDLVANITVIAFLGAESDPYIAYCDHSDNDTWSSPIKVGDHPRVEPYSFPQIVQTPDGHFHVFYALHTVGLRYSVSENPHDPRTWIDSELNLRTIDYLRFALSYPQPVVSKNGMTSFLSKQLHP